MSGRLIGVGTGPGDPELLTLKAVKAIENADVIAHFAKRGNRSNARVIVAAHIRPGVTELPLLYPVTTEIAKDDPAYKRAITAFYEESAEIIEVHLKAGRAVAVLSEGDPLFYGSYMHLHVRLVERYPTEVIAGVTAMSGCWSAVGVPITQGDDVLAVLPGTLAEAELQRRVNDADACVIMKVGRNLPKIRRALEAAGRLSEAMFVERGTMEGMHALRLADKTDDKAAYFSIVLVPGWQGKGTTHESPSPLWGGLGGGGMLQDQPDNSSQLLGAPHPSPLPTRGRGNGHVDGLTGNGAKP